MNRTALAARRLPAVLASIMLAALMVLATPTPAGAETVVDGAVGGAVGGVKDALCPVCGAFSLLTDAEDAITSEIAKMAALGLSRWFMDGTASVVNHVLLKITMGSTPVVNGSA